MFLASPKCPGMDWLLLKACGAPYNLRESKTGNLGRLSLKDTGQDGDMNGYDMLVLWTVMGFSWKP